MRTIIKEPKYMGWSKKGFYFLAAFLLLSVLFLLGIIVSPEYAFGGAIIKGFIALPGQVIPCSTAAQAAAVAARNEKIDAQKASDFRPSDRRAKSERFEALYRRASAASVSKASPELLEDAVQTHPSSFPLDTMKREDRRTKSDWKRFLKKTQI